MKTHNFYNEICMFLIAKNLLNIDDHTAKIYSDFITQDAKYVMGQKLI